MILEELCMRRFANVEQTRKVWRRHELSKAGEIYGAPSDDPLPSSCTGTRNNVPELLCEGLSQTAGKVC